jgi:hypothetical protein
MRIVAPYVAQPLPNPGPDLLNCTVVRGTDTIRLGEWTSPIGG